ncbi:hypothetical protein ACJRPK_13400 [Aquimarina sp. 2-A2]|uniref:hypothetical protein n=1 Tax=Aquimarina sp. 2-A2 TaxID=3382644 RepID=UPI00387F2F1D
MKKTKSGKYIKWTPIFDIKNSGYYAGVDKYGNWFADTAEGLKSLEEGGILGILPILEMNRTDFGNYLNEKIDESELNSDFQIAELEIEVIKVSFGISTHWAELGIEWLNENEINPELKKGLNWLIENEKYSQKFRHKAFAKIKRFGEINKGT